MLRCLPSIEGYEFNRFGGGYDGDEAMRTFLFTAGIPVNGFLTDADMTEFVSVTNNYPTDFWSSFSASGFYTTTAADVGKTFYFGMEHLNPGGIPEFPRIELVRLEAVENKRPIISGTLGDGDFEYPEVPGDAGVVMGALWYTNHPNWFNASGSEGINFSHDTQTADSSQPNSRAGMPFRARKQVNNAGYTVLAAGQEFDLSYDFGRMGVGYDNDEAMRTFLFTSDVPVNGALAESNMTEFAEVIYTYPTTEYWTSFETNGSYTTTSSDVGKTFYLGIEHLNPAGPDVFPRIDVIDLCVTLPSWDVCPMPLLSIALNGANVDVSWDSTDGCSYQLQTNDTLDVNWGNYGAAVAGDGSTKTDSIPAVGVTLNIRAEVQ